MNIGSQIKIVNSLDSIKEDILNGRNHHRNENVHRFFQYPAMMVPSVQESIIKTLSKVLPNNSWVLDPFMGSATTLVSSMKYGFNVFGQDINPLSILISQVKTGPYKYEELIESYYRILKLITSDKKSKIEINYENIDKWFNHEIQIELSKIRRSIIKEEDLTIRKFFWVALAETIRLSSNDRTSTYKLHMRSFEEICSRKVSAIYTFNEVCLRNLDDLNTFRESLKNLNLLIKNKYRFEKTVTWGDSAYSINSKKKFNLLITSPPYGDNLTTVTYGQHSFLPLLWIPFEDIDDSIPIDLIRTTQEIDRQSLGGKNKREFEQKKSELLKKSNELDKINSIFLNEDKNKLKKILIFIFDLNNSIDTCLKVLNKDSFLVWTIGNRHVSGKEIKNDKILTELLNSKGIELMTKLEREILNKRMPSRNNFSKTMDKEKILIYRKPY